MLDVELTPLWEVVDNQDRACAIIKILYNGKEISQQDCTCTFYFDGNIVRQFLDVTNISTGNHTFMVVVNYKEETKIISKDKFYSKYSDDKIKRTESPKKKSYY